ncbi:hypothetical protein J4477_04890 [Candidatus Pacearchaeota archaeon]|nr:hypothetical protein [Candidatus Pacearchaeota archaeon]
MQRKSNKPGCLSRLIDGALTLGVVLVIGGIGYVMYRSDPVVNQPEIIRTEIIDGYQLVERENRGAKRVFYHNEIRDKDTLILNNDGQESVSYTDFRCDNMVDVIFSVSGESYKRDEIEFDEKARNLFDNADIEFKRNKEEMFRVEY